MVGKELGAPLSSLADIPEDYREEFVWFLRVRIGSLENLQKLDDIRKELVNGSSHHP